MAYDCRYYTLLKKLPENEFFSRVLAFKPRPISLMYDYRIFFTLLYFLPVKPSEILKLGGKFYEYNGELCVKTSRGKVRLPLNTPRIEAVNNGMLFPMFFLQKIKSLSRPERAVQKAMKKLWLNKHE